MRNPKPKTSASLLIVPMIALVATLTASAQEAVPMLVNYQGELRSPTTGDPVPDGNYDMLFELWDGPGIRAQSVWRSLHTRANGNPVEIKGGLFNVVLGSGKALKASVFDESERWLETSVEGETLSPRQRIISAAYSLVSENSRLLDGKEASEYVIQAQGLRLQPTATTPNIIAGHEDNAVTDGVVGATISGGGTSSSGWRNVVTDAYGTIGGGLNNLAGDNAGTTEDARWATVGGGQSNVASADGATVGGGADNTAAGYAAMVGGGQSNGASGDYATVPGGRNNTASGDYATIGGGGPSDPTDAVNTNNRVFDDYGTIGGGGYNRAGSDDADATTATYATVGGGQNNTASGEGATVGGGAANRASGGWATVAGGGENTAGGFYATIGGGHRNMASGPSSRVAGGYDNTASGICGMVGGGRENTAAGTCSFAAGQRAKANHDGCFVWGDLANLDVPSTANNQFIARASGGVRFYSNSGLTTGVRLSAGGGSWGTISDRALKDNPAPTDAKEVLKQLMSVPISTWNYKTQEASIRHMGPMAQDFYEAFGLGEDDKHITTVDADGVALAAIQGLHEIVKEKDAKISSLEARIETLEALVEKLAESQPGGAE